MSETITPTVNIIQSVAILIDGNNIERSLHSMTNDDNCMINFDNLIPKLLRGRGLSRLIYFREGNQISSKLADRLLAHYMGSVVPCHKSADIPLSISATQIARKVDTIIILSGDSDYVELVRHLKGEGVRIEIAAVKATTAQILIDESDHFIEITEEDSFSLTPKRSNTKRSSSKSNTQRKSSTKSSNSNSSSTSNKKSSTSSQTKNSNTSTKNNSRSSSKATASDKSNSNKKSSTKNSSKKSASENNSQDNNKSEEKSTQKKTSQKSQAKSKSSKKTKSNSPKRATRSPRKRATKKVEPIDDFSY